MALQQSEIVRGMLRFILIAAAVFSIAIPLYAQEFKIGFIDLERLGQESPQGRKILNTLKAEFAPREQEIIRFQEQIKEARDRFEAEKTTLSDSQRNERWKPIADMMKQSDRMVYALQEDAKLRREQMTGDFVRERNAAIDVVVKAGSFDLVVHQAYFNSKRVDITDQVLAEMAKRASGGGS